MKKEILLILFLVCLLKLAAQEKNIIYGSNPSAGHYAAINGIELYYEEYGEGDPLLMLHGNGGSIEAFKEQIPFFEKHFRVIAVDSRLHGKSGGSEDTLSYTMMAADFCALLDYLDLDSAFVLGWSDGGIDGLLMALDCPGHVRKLAISGANTRPDSTAIPAQFVRELSDFVLGGKASSQRELTLNRMMLFQPNITNAELGKISCPVLVMAGDHDLILAEHTLEIFQSIPGAELCIFPGAHHGVCQQHPNLFNTVVFDFFSGINK